MAIFLSGKKNRQRKITGDEGHYILIKVQCIKKIENNCEYICTQYQNPNIYEVNTDRLERKNSYVIVGDFNSFLSIIGRIAV